MKKIGLILKEARESQGLSLEDVAQRTKIHIEKLRSIEANDFSSLPAKVFIKGLIKSYAKELKIDAKIINDSFNQEFEEPVATVAPTTQAEPVFDDEDDEKRPVGRFQAPNSFFIIIAATVAIILSIFIYATVSKINSYSREERTPPQITVTEDLRENNKTETTSTDVASTTEVKDEPTPPSVIKQVSPKVIEEKTATPAKEESIEKPAPKLEVEPKVEVSKPLPVTPKPKPAVDVDEYNEDAEATVENTDLKTVTPEKQETTIYSDNKIVIEAIEAVRVQITWSDGQPQVVLMKERERKTFVFSNPLKFNINNGGAVNITYNNKFLGVPGTLNTPIELKYP